MQQIKEMGITESERIKKLKADYEADIDIYKQKISDQEIIIKERSDKVRGLGLELGLGLGLRHNFFYKI